MGTTAEKLAYLADTKTAIKGAIVAKGVEVPEGTTFRGYAEKIEEIKGAKTIKVVFKSVEDFPSTPSSSASFYYLDLDGTVKSFTFTGNEDLINSQLEISIMSNTPIVFYGRHKDIWSSLSGAILVFTQTIMGAFGPSSLIYVYQVLDNTTFYYYYG